MDPHLQVLHSEIDSRASEIRRAADWPCREGCDACCRRLGGEMLLTRAEWELLWEGMERLEAHGRRIEISTTGRTCPFLDPDAGACLVYDYRPVACRTYGFYVERDQGLYCAELQARVERGEYRDAVWGNAAAIEARLDALGPRLTLTKWLEVRGLSAPPPEPFAAESSS